MGNKLIKVILEKGAWRDRVLYCIADSCIKEKDIVIVEPNFTGKQIGICVCDNFDVSELNSCYVKLPFKRAFYICQSTHDITSSRNNVLKSLLAANDISISELIDIYDTSKKWKELGV